tara:strand:+ start:3262 stop:4068 length:807 start_codon:yes stop_codon:yes gene_type:complete
MNKDEQILRENIQQLIKHVKQKKISEEQEVRNHLKKLMKLELQKMLTEADVPDVDPTPNKSTGINVLEQLLKKIVPVLQVDYKSLTTSEEQRNSFRAHIVNAVINTLTPAKVNNQAGEEEADLESLDEDIDIEIGGEDDDKFIDIRTDQEKKAEEEEQAPDEREEFGTGVDGDETGRNMAYESFKKIQSSVIDSYELLSNPEDQEVFYDYLIANLKLYFDKFESELAGQVEEPTNQAYDDAKAEEPAAAAGGGEDLGLGAEEEVELEF